MPNTKRLARGFDIVSGFYDSAVHLFFGTKIDTFQAKVLRQITRCDEAIIVGGGTGRILKVALKTKLAKRYSYVEISEKMQKQTKARLTAEELQQVSFYNEIDQLKTKADIVLLPFVLDCYSDNDAADILKSLSKGLRASGSIMVIDFAESSKWFQRAFILILYKFFGVVAGISTDRLPNYDGVFANMGYRLIKKDEILGSWIFAAEGLKNQKNPEGIENDQTLKAKNVI